MNILTDILSLLKRKQLITVAGEEDVLVLGVHEPPDIEGIASPIPYKNVKLIKVKDFVDFNKCIHRNIPAGDSYAGVFKDETEDIDGECYVNLRRLKSLSLNLTITENGDFIDFENLAEANTVINVGTGAEVYKDKIGEEFRLRTLVSSDASLTITQNADEIDFVVASFVNIYNTDGVLTGNRILDGNSTHALTFDNLNSFRSSSLGGTAQIIDTLAGTGTAEVLVSGGASLSLSFIDLTIGPGAQQRIDMLGSASGFLVTDTANNRGMVYSADYSPNFINESLVTKRYVDAQILDLTFQALSGGLVTWDIDNGVNAKITLAGGSILSITNAQNGDYGTLIIKQDAIGGHTLGLPANFKVVNGGGGAISISTGPNEEDIISWVYDGTDFFGSFGLNFT